MAERGGFEPPVPVSRYGGLANRCIKPLSHLSVMSHQKTTDQTNASPDAGIRYELAPHRTSKTCFAATKSELIRLDTEGKATEHWF